MSDKVVNMEEFLSAQDILDSDDLELVPVTIPEWKKNGKPGKIFLKVMSGARVISFQERLKDPKNKNAAFIEMFAECAVDPKGNQLFPTGPDVELLKKKSAAVFLRLQQKLMELNGIARKEKTWEELRKILVANGVDDAVIAKVQAHWDTPLDEAKNA